MRGDRRRRIRLGCFAGDDDPGDLVEFSSQVNEMWVFWPEVLDADTVDGFTENGGLTRENRDRFRARLLGVGGTKDPIEAYVDFRGRRAELELLLKRRGLS